MTRSVYRGLLWLHPADFRRRFAGEMLWIFDEAAATEGPGHLLADGLVSLAKQWLVRRGAWKVLAAGMAALLEVLLIMQLSPRSTEAATPARWAFATHDFDFSRLLAFLFVGLVISAAVAATPIRTRRGPTKRGR